MESPPQVQIGCHTDDLTKASKLSRAPVVTHQCLMDRTKRSVSCLWGGLLYVIVPKGSKLGPVSVTVKRAVPAPYYKLGKWPERRGGLGMHSGCGLVAQQGSGRETGGGRCVRHGSGGRKYRTPRVLQTPGGIRPVPSSECAEPHDDCSLLQCRPLGAQVAFFSSREVGDRSMTLIPR